MIVMCLQIKTEVTKMSHNLYALFASCESMVRYTSNLCQNFVVSHCIVRRNKLLLLCLSVYPSSVCNKS